MWRLRRGTCLLIGKRGTFRRRLSLSIAGFLFLIVAVNLSVWLTVITQKGPFWEEYARGRVIRIGSTALIFGHGSWITDTIGMEKHMTTAYYRGKRLYLPTLDLVTALHKEGAQWIWGTWCYAGDRPYVERDLITGKETPWPLYISRSKGRGVVYPVWIVFGFIRLTDNKASIPAQRFALEKMTTDTIHIPFYSYDINRENQEGFLRKLEQIIRARMSEKGLSRIRPDSINKVYRDTVVYDYPLTMEQMFGRIVGGFGSSYREVPVLTPRQKKYKKDYDARKKAATKVVRVTAWFREKEVLIWLKIDPYILDKTLPDSAENTTPISNDSSQSLF